VVRIERYANVAINVTQSADGSSSSTLVSSNATPFAASSTTYDAAGQVSTTVDPAGHSVSYQYDLDGRTTITADTVGGLQREIQTVYDAAGRAVESIDALGHATYFTYDAAGNIVSTTYANGSSDSATYNTQGHLVSRTDQLGETTNYRYDTQGDATAVALPTLTTSGSPIRPEYQYGYDKYGNRVSVTGPLGAVTSFGFDALGHQIADTLPPVSGQVTLTATATYNDLGQLATSADYKGQITVYTYDVEGRVKTKTYYASATDYQVGKVSGQTTYAYDLNESDGVHTTVTDSLGTTDTLYDAEGRPIQIVSPQGTIHYVYDPATSEHIETWTANSDTTYGYDEEGRLSTVTVVKRNGVKLTTSLMTTHQYDLDNNLISQTLPNGVTTTYGYDALNRLKSVVTKNTAGTLLSDDEYTLLANGMRSVLSETELESTGTDFTTTVDWFYDALARLTEEQSLSTLPARTYTTFYTYLCPVQPPAAVFLDWQGAVSLGHQSASLASGERSGGGERRPRIRQAASPRGPLQRAMPPRPDFGGLSNFGVTGAGRSEPGSHASFRPTPGGPPPYDVARLAASPSPDLARSPLRRGTTRSRSSEATKSPAPLLATARRSPVETSRNSGRPSSRYTCASGLMVRPPPGSLATDFSPRFGPVLRRLPVARTRSADNLVSVLRGTA